MQQLNVDLAKRYAALLTSMYWTKKAVMPRTKFSDSSSIFRTSVSVGEFNTRHRRASVSWGAKIQKETKNNLACSLNRWDPIVVNKRYSNNICKQIKSQQLTSVSPMNKMTTAMRKGSEISILLQLTQRRRTAKSGLEGQRLAGSSSSSIALAIRHAVSGTSTAPASSSSSTIGPNAAPGSKQTRPFDCLSASSISLELMSYREKDERCDDLTQKT